MAIASPSARLSWHAPGGRAPLKVATRQLLKCSSNFLIVSTDADSTERLASIDREHLCGCAAQLRPEGVIQLVLALRVAPRLLLLLVSMAPRLKRLGPLLAPPLLRRLLLPISRASQRLCCSSPSDADSRHQRSASARRTPAHLLDIRGTDPQQHSSAAAAGGVCQRLGQPL